MIRFAEEQKAVLSVVSQHRYNPIVRAIDKYVKSGGLGNLSLISGFLQCNKTQQYYEQSVWRGKLDTEGGSTLKNQAIHTLDLMILLAGFPTEIFTIKDNLKFKEFIETEDTLVSIMRFGKMTLGSISSTNTSKVHWDSNISLVGTEGSLQFTTGHPIKIIASELSPSSLSWLEELKALENLEQDTTNSSESYYGVSHRRQLTDFFNAVYSDSKLFMQPIEALNTLRAVHLIYGK
jgi:predicted dehydrogenase